MGLKGLIGGVIGVNGGVNGVFGGAGGVSPSPPLIAARRLFV